TDGVVERADLELVVLDDETGDPAVATGLLLGGGSCEYLDEIGVRRVRDPLFGAIDDPLVARVPAGTFGVGVHVRRVGADAGFGLGERGRLLGRHRGFEV